MAVDDRTADRQTHTEAAGNGGSGFVPSILLMIALAADVPCCMATCATPGNGLPFGPEASARSSTTWISG
jgi:hypothetical protein